MKKTLFLGAILFVGACDLQYLDGVGQPLAKMTFEHVKKYPVSVASYEPVALTNKVRLPEGFVANPADVIYNYFDSRFEASGSQGKLKITIKDISVSHEIKKSENKIAGVIGVDRSDHYLLRAEIIIQTYGLEGYDDQKITIRAYKNIYISEHSPVVVREKEQMQALDKIIDDLDIAVRRILHNKFSLL